MQRFLALLALLPFLVSNVHAAEGRIEISQADMPLSITTPGSFILTENLTGVGILPGISITASNVTVDLNGYSLIGIPGASDGILVSTDIRRNITVRNGIIREWPGDGIDGDLGTYCVYQDLIVFDNSGSGLVGGNGTRVVNCTSSDNGGDGIRCGENSLVTECVTDFNSDDGIDVDEGSTVQNSVSTDNVNNGIYGREACLIKGNNVFKNTASATTEAQIRVDDTSQVINNNCVCRNLNTTSSRGVYISNDDNVVMNNLVSHCSDGVELASGANDNVVSGNIATANSGDDYDAQSGNLIGFETDDASDTNNVNSANGTMNLWQ